MLEKIIPSVLAQKQLELDYPEFAGLRPETVAAELPAIVSYVFGAGIILVGLVVFAALFWGSFIWMTAAGNPVRLKEGKDRIVSAFLGVIILLSSYIILNTINPQLVSFDFLPLPQPESTRIADLDPLEPDEITLISKELPLGQAIEQGIWQEERTNKTKKLFDDFDIFLKKEFAKGSSGNSITGIASLNKYLETLTQECQCGEMEAITTPASQGGRAIACTGEPCSDETRKEMKRILDLNKAALEDLLDFRKLILEEKNALETELTKFGEIEETMAACQLQSGGIYSLNEYANLAQFYDEQGSKTAVLPTHYASRADPLTFYCPLGGTAFDAPYPGNLEAEIEIDPDLWDPVRFERQLGFSFEPISCPVEIPLGKVVDDLRKEAILLSINMEGISLLVDDISSEMNNMSGLVDEFNGKDCKPKSSCIRNPCYMKCAYFCAPFCRPKCLQAIGACYGIPGPREKVAETVEKIKELEDELFFILRKTQKVFSRADLILLTDLKHPINLQNVRTAVQLTSSAYETGEFGLEQDWVLLNCEAAIGNIGPDGLIIGSCQPRNFFACTPSGAPIPAFPKVIKDRIFTVSQPPKYGPLPASSDNCPEGWLCSSEVTLYNQYADASEPTKELLSCMRQRLDRVQEEIEVKETLGRITSISDSKLAMGTCDWGAGPLTPGGCSYTYSIRFGQESVSAHYGGPFCRYQRVSYAIDISTKEFYEKKYMEEIIDAAEECAPGAYIAYQIPEHYTDLHISIGRIYQCGTN